MLQAQTFLPEGKGKELLDTYCQECHSIDRITKQAWSEPQWRKTVVRMVEKGASLKKVEIDALVEYLVVYFGPETTVSTDININLAEAGDLEQSLGIDLAEAQAMVHYRTAVGRFSSWEDLTRMNEALAKKLLPKRGRIRFGSR